MSDYDHGLETGMHCKVKGNLCSKPRKVQDVIMTLQHSYLFQVTVVTPVGDPLRKRVEEYCLHLIFFNVLLCVFSKQNEWVC